MKYSNTKNSGTCMEKGARGTKIMKSTGQDTSSFGDTGVSSIKHNMKGGVHDASSSLAGAKTPSRK